MSAMITPTRPKRPQRPRALSSAANAWHVLFTSVVRRRPTEGDRWTFEVVLEEDTIDGGYTAECVSLPGCVAQGDTPAETLENLADAIHGVLAVKMEDAISEQGGRSEVELGRDQRGVRTFTIRLV